MIVGLNKNKNYSIVKRSDGTITVNCGNGTQVISSSVTAGGEKADNGVVAYCDEYAELYDGRILKRLRDALSVD